MNKRRKVDQNRLAVDQSERSSRKDAIMGGGEGNLVPGNNSDHRFNKKCK